MISLDKGVARLKKFTYWFNCWIWPCFLSRCFCCGCGCGRCCSWRGHSSSLGRLFWKKKIKVSSKNTTANLRQRFFSTNPSRLRNFHFTESKIPVSDGVEDLLSVSFPDRLASGVLVAFFAASDRLPPALETGADTPFIAFFPFLNWETEIISPVMMSIVAFPYVLASWALSSSFCFCRACSLYFRTRFSGTHSSQL